VWFPDPEVSDTAFFTDYPDESSARNMITRQSPYSPTKIMPGGRRMTRRRSAALSSDTNIHDESHVSAPSANVNTTYGGAKGKTEFAIDTEFQNETLVKKKMCLEQV
jgi:hypothetical protein